MKTLPIYVYRSSKLGDCTNGGISSRHDQLYVVCPEGIYDFDNKNPPENVVKVVRHAIGNRDVYHLEPVKPAVGAGWMAGGNYAACSDSRISRMTNFYGALAIHDRDEYWKTYDMMSR